jgi:hypothetical protein
MEKPVAKLVGLNDALVPAEVEHQVALAPLPPGSRAVTGQAVLIVHPMKMDQVRVGIGKTPGAFNS